MMKTKYVLVSQGIKIYETYDKKEAERIAKENNKQWRKYVERCIEEHEPYADNEVFVVEESE